MGSVSRRVFLGGALGAGAGMAVAAGDAWATPRSAGWDGPPDGSGLRWRHYPYDLQPGDPQFVLPGAEGLKPDHGTDTWFIEGKLTGERTGREYAFMVIYAKNRVADLVRLDFYTFALFDLESGEYGTFTEYDAGSTLPLPAAKLHGAPDHLDLSFATSAGTARWTTRRGAGGLLPFAYRLDLVGTDQRHRPMGLRVDVDPVKRPAVLGAQDFRGVIECFGQRGTRSYFQTGPRLAGTLRWGEEEEPVTGKVGHIDRQWFPIYAGVKEGPFARDRSHEWRTINLDDGTDLSIWRQFDRTRRNALRPFAGPTRYVPGDRPDDPPTVEWTGGLQVQNLSYVRFPSNVTTLVPPPSPNRWAPDRHRLRVPAWQLELTCHPLVPAPAHFLPVEYLIGPCRYTGTLRGRPIAGFGLFERTLVYYRDWELLMVLRDTATHLPAPELARRCAQLAPRVDRGDRVGARLAVETSLRPAVRALPAAQRAAVTPILDDLAHSLTIV